MDAKHIALLRKLDRLGREAQANQRERRGGFGHLPSLPWDQLLPILDAEEPKDIANGVDCAA